MKKRKVKRKLKYKNIFKLLIVILIVLIAFLDLLYFFNKVNEYEKEEKTKEEIHKTKEETLNYIENN